MKLFNYWRSSASWRVRLALAFKGLQYHYEPVNLAGGAQHGEAHRARNPTGAVPVLELDDGQRVVQSVAIFELLEELHPSPPLLPPAPVDRAHVRALVEVVNSGTQPFQNLTTLKHLREVLLVDEKAFARHFIALGLSNLEALAAPRSGRFLFQDAVTFADCCLVPQLYGARRFDVDLRPYPTLTRVEALCLTHPAFVQASADAQPDALP